MTSVRPIALVHRGRHLAAGILLDDRLAGSGAARRRALALWEPGARVVEVEGGIFLRFARPRILDAASAPGHLALEAGGCLLAAPLTAAERASLDPPPGSVVVVRAGVAVALAPGAELDPSAWLELEPVLLDVEPLGDPPPAPAPPPQAASPDVRRALSIAPAAPGAAAAQAALSAAARRAATSASGGGLPARAGRALGGIGAWLAGGAARLASLFTAGSRPGLPSLGAGPASSGLLWVALRQLWQRFLFLTRIARLAGARQGAYVGRLLRMFERGDLGEALRHAIPLGGAQVEHKPIALGVPSARERLDIEPDAAAPGSSYAFGAELYAEMQRLYRRAFEQLDAQGRVEEAAFVLAELLRTDAEAVSYLERHGRARLAAELAEARGLAPGLVVRQWFLARDVERAVAVARAHGAFADAVDRLERAQKKEEAQALALCWAEDLAEAGDLETAIRVAAKVPSAGRLAERWTELAVNAGGPAGHALLRAWLELAPERFPQVRERVLAACGDEGPSGPALRAAVARGLLGRGSGDRPLPEVESGLRALARPVVRAMMTDRALGRAASGDLEKLSALGADGAFEADLPSLRHRPEPKVPLTLELDAGDRGARPALDAAILPCGRILAALGEGGAALLARDGRPIARIDAPAHRLAVSELGTRALALAPRGEAVRISRLDLEARVARPARDLRIRAFAESYDGATWAAAGEGGAFIVDCLRDDLRTLWHVAELGGAPFAVARRATELTFATLGDGACEGWVYALPRLALRRRSPIPLPEVPFPFAPIAFAGGEWYGAYPAEEGALILRRAAPGDQPGFWLAGTPSDLVQLAGGDLLAVALRVEAGIEVSVLKPPGLRLMAKVRLGGARNAHVRTAAQTVTLVDDCGRVVGIDLAAMRVTHDARL